MFILAAYGYKQGQIYNINCQTAPLIDAIKRQAYTDVCNLLNNRQIQIIREIEETSHKLENKQKKLQRLENPPPEEEIKDLTSAKSRFRQPSDPNNNPSKLEENAEETKKNEEAKETKDAKKPEPPRGKNEKPKKEEPKKAGAKKPVVEEVKELTPEEIKQQKLEAEKEEVRKIISEIQSKKDKLNEKLEKIENEKDGKSVVEHTENVTLEHGKDEHEHKKTVHENMMPSKCSKKSQEKDKMQKITFTITLQLKILINHAI